MDRKLDEYRQKRDASRTNEPMGDEPGRRGPTVRGAFVVHQHDATGMHWDLRLEVGGVLASFAVPHGPSLDPEKRHLAVQTEDHPIEYLDFEAVIPPGTYGAGPMIVWDHGAVRYLETSAEEGLETGKLHFALEGRKLHGRFGLVRVKPRGGSRARGGPSREWLLLKKKDEHADPSRDVIRDRPRSVLSGLTVDELAVASRIADEVEAEAARLGAPLLRGPFPAKLEPMLCTAGPVPAAAGWLYELKLDGVRIIARKDDRDARLAYRSQRDATNAYPEVVRAVQALAPRRLVLDGEIVAFDDHGRPSFHRLATRIHGGGPRVDMRAAMMATPVVFMVFDVLAIGERDLRPLPLIVRKGLLARLLPAPGVLRAHDHVDRSGGALLAFCKERGLEGVVAKRANAPYREGPARTGDWVKTKCEREADFVVVGWTKGDGRKLGALDVATWEGGRLVVRGKVGSGLDDATMRALLRDMAKLEAPGPTAAGSYVPAPRGRVHVRPELVVGVRFQEWSPDGNVRHPVFLGVRPDRDTRTCTEGPGGEDEGAPPESPRAVEESADGATVDPAASPAPAASGPAPVVAITNRAKVFWPAEGLTKGDLVDYYVAVAPWLLPYLDDRPVVLVRYPDGIEGKSFYQWNVPHGIPPWVRSVNLGKHAHAAEGDEAHRKHVFIVDRTESLAYLANLACIPIHVLASRVASPDEADWLTVDFDVGRASLRAAIPLALLLRSICDRIGLPSYPKTSGQSGLHVFVGLGRGTSPVAARTLADLLGRMLCEAHPDVATMERVVAKRGARVYVDTGQTGASRTIVAPLSVRATAGARVSTPLTWDEVVPELDPGAFTIRTVPERLATMGDPMAALLRDRPDMGAVMERLGALVAGGRAR